MNLLDRVILEIAPRAGLRRVQARRAAEIVQRHYEAAAVGRRTQNWKRSPSDANSALAGALPALRELSRDLIRNNVWARRGQRSIANNAVGWGITPSPVGLADAAEEKVSELWEKWAGTTACDADGRQTFYGMQRLIMRTLVESGEVIVRQRPRRVDDGHPIPMQLQVLEPDYLDIWKSGVMQPSQNVVIQGIEFNQIGQRVAYWLFKDHPGAYLPMRGLNPISYRIPAEQVIHVYLEERKGQVRGVPWMASAVLKLKDFDEFEDATIMKQKIAACFAVFVTDTDGAASPLGDSSADDPLVDTIEPGMVVHTAPGRSVTSAAPPPAGDYDPLTKNVLRGVAAGLGTTYEELTGDYSNVNFSSGRLGRLAFQQNIHEWQYDLLIPIFCAPAWNWAMTWAQMAGQIQDVPAAEWTSPPFAMMDPEKEGRASMLLVRNGQQTPDDMVRAQGNNPRRHWKRYGENLKTLDENGIVLDIDARARTQIGNPTTYNSAGEGATSSAPKPGA